MSGWEFPHRRARNYHACQGCTASWVWSDRISDIRWGCDKCGTPWPTGGHHWQPARSLTKKLRKPRGRDRQTVEPPPGLVGKSKQQSNVVETTLTPEPEPQPLEEAHLESLPKEVKEVVEGLLKPAPTAIVDVTRPRSSTRHSWMSSKVSKRPVTRSISNWVINQKLMQNS